MLAATLSAIRRDGTKRYCVWGGYEADAGIDGSRRRPTPQIFCADTYRHFYYLTSERHGEFILRLLSDGRTAELDDILRQDLFEARANWSMENDAMDGKDPVLFGYTCDMPRIKRFCIGLQTHGLRGALYCFDFQEEVLSKICGPDVRIQCIAFEKVEQIF